MTEMTIVKAVNQALSLAMEKDPSIVLIGEDIGRDGGVFRVTEGLIDKFGAVRVMDSPLAESGLMGAALGMANNGLKPIVEIQFSGFFLQGLDQFISHMTRIRNRTRGKLTAQIVIRMPYGGGIRALEHHSESQEAILAHVPGCKIVIPSSPHNAKGLLLAAIEDPDPVIFMESEKMYRALKEEVPDEYYVTPLGKARIAQEGKDMTLITYGAMTKVCMDAVEYAKEQKINVEVIDLLTVWPMDIDTIVASVKKTGRVLVVHEGVRTCGIAAEICALINEKAFEYLQAPVQRVTGYDVVFPYYKIENYYLPDSDRILDAILALNKYVV